MYNFTPAQREEALREANAALVWARACSAYCETMENRGIMTWRDAKHKWNKMSKAEQEQWHGLKNPREVNEEARTKCRDLITNGNTDVQQILDILMQMTR